MQQAQANRQVTAHAVVGLVLLAALPRHAGRVTQALPAVVPRGRVLALDASADMVALARERLGDRASVWCQDVLDLDLEEAVDAIVSTAALHWVSDHDRLWERLAPWRRARSPVWRGATSIACAR